MYCLSSPLLYRMQCLTPHHLCWVLSSIHISLQTVCNKTPLCQVQNSLGKPHCLLWSSARGLKLPKADVSTVLLCFEDSVLPKLQTILFFPWQLPAVPYSCALPSLYLVSVRPDPLVDAPVAMLLDSTWAAFS